jgi:hypothetical protein
MADNDNPQLSLLGEIITKLPAVRALKKVNTLSRVHRRLIEPIETDQDNEGGCLFSTRFFVRLGTWIW